MTVTPPRRTGTERNARSITRTTERGVVFRWACTTGRLRRSLGRIGDNMGRLYARGSRSLQLRAGWLPGSDWSKHAVESVEHLGVAPRATAIFWGACPLAPDTAWVVLTVAGGEHFLDLDDMLPAVAEVVFVLELGAQGRHCGQARPGLVFGSRAKVGE